MAENYLAHYGILGMKWGIRRFQPYSVRGRKSGEGGREIGLAKKRANNSPSHEELLKSTNPTEVYNNKGQLNDRELRERVNRIQTEQQLKELMYKDQKKKKEGKNIVLNVLGRVGTMTAAAIASAIFKEAINPKIEMGKEVVAEIINDPSIMSDFVDFITGTWKP